MDRLLPCGVLAVPTMRGRVITQHQSGPAGHGVLHSCCPEQTTAWCPLATCTFLDTNGAALPRFVQRWISQALLVIPVRLSGHQSSDSSRSAHASTLDPKTGSNVLARAECYADAAALIRSPAPTPPARPPPHFTTTPRGSADQMLRDKQSQRSSGYLAHLSDRRKLQYTACMHAVHPPNSGSPLAGRRAAC